MALAAEWERSPVGPSVPTAVRRLTRFHKLTPRAVDGVLAALEQDDAFRQSVAEVVDSSTVELGPAVDLWLRRPDGWADELAALEVVPPDCPDLPPTMPGADERDRLEARLAAQTSLTEQATAAAARADDRAAAAERATADLTAQLDRLTVALDDERAHRRQREQEADEARRAASAQALARREIEDALTATRAALASASAERSAVVPAPLVDEPPPEAPTAEANEVHELPWLDVALGLRRAAEAAGGLAAALADLAALVPRPDVASVDVPTADAPVGRDRRVSPRALVLPGLDEMSVDGARWLASSRAHWLVDGYNTSMALWPHLPIADQRIRLVRLLDELAVRVRSAVDVVFDGDGDSATTTGPSGSRSVTVRFSAAAVEADDDVLDLVDRVRPAAPVVVVSADKRVVEGARRRGANVVSPAQLGAWRDAGW